ncbi:hypothetical protein PMLGA01_090018800, partial [Plasmodium malariae]
MTSAKRKFEFARNRSTNSIKENLLCSSYILKNSDGILKTSSPLGYSQIKQYDEKEEINDYVHREKFANNIFDFINSNEELHNNTKLNNNSLICNELQKEFSNGIFYDKIVSTNK